MNTEFLAFGEMLWDCLPSGRHAGGAPFNVAAHLAHLGASVSLLSAVGQDLLGDELLHLGRLEGIDIRFVQRARSGLPTGTVQVILDENANAAYSIVQPVAWDEISVSPEALISAVTARAIVFGSLACRSPDNIAQLDRLLGVPGPRKFFDVNLRTPFFSPDLILHYARQADIIKLNEEELYQIASWVKNDNVTGDTPAAHGLAMCCASLAEATHTSRICVTRGAQGAVFWDDGKIFRAPSPPVIVEDTVGAGDAFMAGLVMGLTRGIDLQKVLTTACRLGAYVASQRGATPALPADMAQNLTN